jgi:putative transposase
MANQKSNSRIIEHCKTNHDRDINASINIRNEALRILSLGTSDTANGGNVRRTGKTSVLSDAIPNEIRSPNYTACG